MARAHSLLDVFADSPFQDIEIPVVQLNGQKLSDAHKQAIAMEFQKTETVLIDTAPGTCTFSVDRGSETTRKSILRAKFEKCSANEVRCRIGGHVIKMGVGELLYQ